MKAVQHGTTDVSTVVRFLDSTTFLPLTGLTDASSGLTLGYRRTGGSLTSITPASLAAPNSAHSDGGFEELSNGWYRLDLPDAACASGADEVLIYGSVTGGVMLSAPIALVGYSPQTGIDQGAPLSSAGQVGILHKGGTYWFTVECFDESGASIILDEPPTVVVVKNNVATEDAVTITDRDEDGRHYDCAYNPVDEVEGDRFEIRVSVLINDEVYTRPSEHLVVIASPNLDDRLNEVLTNAREAAQNSQ